MNIAVIKIGGSCLTYKREGISKVRLSFLHEAAKSVRNVLEKKKIKIILVHGGGSITHPLLDTYAVAEKLKSGRLKTKKDMAAAGRIHLAMNNLNNEVVKVFLDEGVPVWPMQTSALFWANKKKSDAISLETVALALENDCVPILHGDLVLDKKTGSAICSGDYVAAFLAGKLNAAKILFASDVNGIYPADPHESKEVKLLKNISKRTYRHFFKIKTAVCDHSGGMKSKLDNIKKYCSACEAVIFNGLKKGNMEKALLGEELGTRIHFN